MLNKTHQKVVNTSNDMFDENYYRLTILGKGSIGPLKIRGIFSGDLFRRMVAKILIRQK